MSDWKICQAGDAALLVELGVRIDPELNRRVLALAAGLRKQLAELPGTTVVPSYASLLVSFEPGALTRQRLAGLLAEEPQNTARVVPTERTVVIPVSYGGEFGPDLDDVARRHDLDPAEVVARHGNRDYRIYCLGFSPGFPYLGGLHESLHTPRLATPRRRLEAGSVGIGGSQTGVYPTSTPGGWRIVGRTPLVLFDASREPPVDYQPGDSLRFLPIDELEFRRLAAQSIGPADYALRVQGRK